MKLFRIANIYRLLNRMESATSVDRTLSYSIKKINQIKQHRWWWRRRQRRILTLIKECPIFHYKCKHTRLPYTHIYNLGHLFARLTHQLKRKHALTSLSNRITSINFSYSDSNRELNRVNNNIFNAFDARFQFHSKAKPAVFVSPNININSQQGLLISCNESFTSY